MDLQMREASSTTAVEGCYGIPCGPFWRVWGMKSWIWELCQMSKVFGPHNYLNHSTNLIYILA